MHSLDSEKRSGAQTASILITGAGAGLLMRGTFPRWSFFAGGVFTYMGTIVLEAVSMSLCSKVHIYIYTKHCYCSR